MCGDPPGPARRGAVCVGPYWCMVIEPSMACDSPDVLKDSVPRSAG